LFVPGSGEGKGLPVAEVEFGRYRLIDQIGRGGMGEVWRAHDTVTERVVALKVLPTQFADDAMFQERFRREARSAAALDEPHVVPIYDFGEIDGRLFVTMRLIRGRDLHGLLSDGPLDASRAVGIIDQVASALHAAHQVNLVHRDVKPSNILVAEDDFAYLIDFGIARAAGQTGLTSTSSVIGTWAYMAPERITAGHTDGRADIYALACVLYECLTGSQPFGGDSLEQQIGGHLGLPPPRASDRRRDVPAGLDGVIAKGMAKNPDDRYSTTRELARAARASLGSAPTGRNTVPPAIAAPAATAPHRPPQSGYLAHQPVQPSGSRPPGPTQFRPQPPQSGYLAHQPVQPSGPWPPGPTQFRPQADRANPPGPKSSRKGRLIAFSSIAAAATIFAVVAAIALNSGDHSSPPAPSTSATPSALRSTGPITGTFTASIGTKTAVDGAAATNDTDFAGSSETWRLRSACGTNGCVATASTGGQYDPAKDLVLDNVGGRWLAVTTSHRTCGNNDNDEAWTVISLQLQPDGTMSGEADVIYANGCFNKRTLTLTRTADVDISLLPDPAALRARLVSPAEALHGSYDMSVTYPNGDQYPDHFAARTDCLRTGDRCMTYFWQPKGNQAFIFGNGTWTRHVEIDDAPCSKGGTNRVAFTTTLPIPQAPQDPIPLLTGHGTNDILGGPGTCRSGTYVERFTRTGD
jgi:serine/threonine protein kinase